MTFEEALRITQAGFDRWAGRPHNRGWFRRIDGTPIPNDLVVTIAEEFAGVPRLVDRPVLPDALDDPGLDPEGEGRPEIAPVPRGRRAGGTVAAVVILILGAIAALGVWGLGG